MNRKYLMQHKLPYERPQMEYFTLQTGLSIFATFSASGEVDDFTEGEELEPK